MPFKAHFLDVGCADCTIFETDNELIIIDCGYRRIGDEVSKRTNIVDYIQKTIGKYYIDLLMVSHPHHDHYLGMQDIIESNMTVAEFWGSPYDRRTGDASLDIDEWHEYCDLKSKLVPNGEKRFTCVSGVTASFSDCDFTVLGPRKTVNQNDGRECHDASLVVRVKTPSTQIIVCGDASDSELDEVRWDHDVSTCHLLRASHHGSINGANLDFIKAAKPINTIVSTRYGIVENLPHDTALQRYKAYTTNKVYRTDSDGTLTAALKSS